MFKSAVFFFLLVFIQPTSLASQEKTISYGKGKCGKLEGGIALPCDGTNYESFAYTACWQGRNYLHPLVAKTIVDAYALLEKTYPNRRWQYGDMGWKDGGSFKPHKTHQNGLSADFFIPVLNQDKKPEKLPISIFNKFGYDIEIDEYGSFQEFNVDWGALFDHLAALKEAGEKHEVEIELIVLDPGFRDILLTKKPELEQYKSTFSKNRAWVRHDEHYHINFKIPQKYRAELKCE